MAIEAIKTTRHRAEYDRNVPRVVENVREIGLHRNDVRPQQINCPLDQRIAGLLYGEANGRGWPPPRALKAQAVKVYLPAGRL